MRRDEHSALQRAMTLFAIDPGTVMRHGAGDRDAQRGTRFATRWSRGATQPDRPVVWIDHPDPFLRLGMSRLLELSGFVVAGHSVNFRPAPALPLPRTLVLFDLDEARVQAAARATEGTTAGLVVIADAPDRELLRLAIERGVSGLLHRDSLSPRALVSCLHTVAEGFTCIAPALAGAIRTLEPEDREDPAEPSDLTRRELDLLKLLADGSDTREIAAQLCYAERTVKAIVHDVLIKMNCRTRAQATAKAIRGHLI